MELNKEYSIENTTIQEAMFNISEFITLIEKFKTFKVDKDYSVELNKVGEKYTAKMTVKDEKQDN